MLWKESSPLTSISFYVVLADFRNNFFVFSTAKSCVMKGPDANLYVVYNLFICFFPHFAYQKVQKVQLDDLDHPKPHNFLHQF